MLALSLTTLLLYRSSISAFQPCTPSHWTSSNSISNTRPPTFLSSSQITDEAGSYDPSKEDLTEAEQYTAANEFLSSNPTIDLPSEISSSFLQYALSIILGRALPDARDGLKPVHRRILYAMNGLQLSPGGGYRKCARVVGEVLGKYHPHGDTAVYDALVRLAQDFTTGTPLIDGHGNFGSIDNDPAGKRNCFVVCCTGCNPFFSSWFC